MFSRLPSCSRWTGAIDVITPRSRPRDPGEVADLAGAAHRHLRHDDLGLGLDPAERERQADLVVEAVRRRDGAQAGAQERREDVLRRRLPDRAGDRHDASIAAGADGTAQRGERGVRVVGHERRRRAARAGVVEERLAARDGDEEVARPDPARVDLDAGDGVGVALEPAQRERPHLGERQRDQVRASNAFRASFAASRSSKGIVRSANSCPCSAPLPAMRTTSPGRASSTRARSPPPGRARPRPRRPRRTRSRRRSPRDPRCAGCRR